MSRITGGFSGLAPGVGVNRMLSALGVGPNIAELLDAVSNPMSRMKLAVEQEMQAYQRDQNAAHLLAVISMLQQFIAENMKAMQSVSEIGALLQGAFSALQPSQPGPSLPPAVLSSIGAMLERVGNSPGPGGMAGPGLQQIPGGGASAGPMWTHQMMAQMAQMTKLMEMLGAMARARNEAAQGVIRNLR